VYDSLKVIYRARNGPEAHLLKNALEEAGIKAVVTNAVLEGGSGVDIVGWPTLPRIAVAAKDARVARLMAIVFERSLSRTGEVQPEEAEQLEPPGAPPWWPRCPGCGAPRLVQCRYCGTAGTGFRLADEVQSEPSLEQSRPLLICPTCDEPMAPQYLEECEWCGHRFADGVAPPQDAFRTEWTWRLVIAAIAVVAIVAGLIVYFNALL